MKGHLSFGLIMFTALFIAACFSYGRIFLLYPLIIIALSIYRFNLGLQFSLFTLGFNAVLFIAPGTLGALHPNSVITLSQIAFVLIGLIKSRSLKLDKRSIIFASFLILAIISLLYTEDKFNGIKVIANLLLYSLTLLAFINIKTDLDLVFKSLLITCGLLILIIYPGQFLVRHDSLFWNDPDRGLRFSGGGVHPVPLSFFFSLVILSSLSLFDKTKERRYLFFMLIPGILLTLTKTRMSLLGLALAFVWYLFKKRKLLYLAPPAVILLAFSFNRILDFFLKRGAEYYQPGADFVSGGRLSFWAYSASEFIDRPLLGHGLGSSAMILLPYRVITPHSDLVRMLLELGAVGFALFAYYLFLQYRAVLLTRNAALMSIFLFALTVICLDSVIDYNVFFTFPLFLIFGVINRRGALQ